MGLDMYLYAASKPILSAEKIYERDELEEKENCILISANELQENAYKDLAGIGVPVKVRTQYINLKKLANEYGYDEGYNCMIANGVLGFTLSKTEKLQLPKENLYTDTLIDTEKVKEAVKDKLDEKSHITNIKVLEDSVSVDIIRAETVELTHEVVSEKYSYEEVEDMFAIQLRELYYWRKAYDVQDIFYENHPSIENCGYHGFSPEFIEENRMALRINQSIEISDDETVIYHEWY